MRPTCLRCLRPTSFCVCAGVPPARARSRLVLLQHPREAGLAICSARLTHVLVEGSELHRGVRFAGHARVRALAAVPGAALLFPGEGARAAATLADAPPPVLFALDATWFHAGRMLRDNPFLAALPRLSVRPAQASAYGELRREPGPEHLSTLEAVALALGALERDPARFEPMREAFRRSVALQLACARGPRHSPRHRGGAARDPAGAAPAAPAGAAVTPEG